MNATRKNCSVDDCANNKVARGYCMKHYQRVRKYGDPLQSAAYSSPEEAFSARTSWIDGCLVWSGGMTDDGYGRMRVNGPRMLSHRYAWERARGPIPDGIIVDHMCHNPACCNVDHLRLVTDKQNSENPSGPRSQGSSGHLGVHQHGNRWRVRVRHYGVTHLGGSFATAEEAAPVAQALRNKLFTHNLLDRIPA